MAKALKIVGLAVAAVGIGLATAGFGAVAFTGAITATISTTAIIAVGAALEVGSALLAKKGSTTASQTDRLTTSIDPRAPRKSVFGRTAFANDLRYEEWFGGQQEYCGWIVAFASHKIESLDEIWINQEQAWTLAGGVVPKYQGYFYVQRIVKEGGPTETFPLSTPDAGKWNSSSRLTGCAFVFIQFRVTGVNSKATSPFSGGVPSKIVFIGRGGLLYDPRRDSTVPGGSGPMRAGDQSTWRYTADDGGEIGANIPLMILRELLGWRITNPATGAKKLAVGGGLPPRRIDMGSFITAASIADEMANRSTGGSEPKFHGGACVSEGDDLHTRLDMLCAACNGRLREVNGKLALVIMHNDLPGAAADDGLNDDDVIGAFTWESDPPLDQCLNVVRGKWTDPSTTSLFQMIDYPEVRLDSPDGIDRTMTLDLSVCQSASHAQRVAKQVLERRQYQRTFSAPFDIRAWKYQVGDPVPFTFSPLSFDRRMMRVASQELTQDGTCVMSLMDENEAIYAWDADDSPPVTAAAPVVYDPTKSPLVLAIGDAAITADWPSVADSDPETHPRPEDGAVNTRRLDAPIGPTKKVSDLLATVDQVSVIEEVGLTSAAADRQRDRDLAQLGETLARLLIEVNGTVTSIRDAGINVDPNTGTVRLFALDEARDHLNDVQVTLDAQSAKITLAATRTYVQEQIALAQIDPSQFPALDDLIARVSQAEIDIDGLQGQITLKASATDLTNLGIRVSDVEQALTAVGDTVGIQTTVRQARYAADLAGRDALAAILSGDIASRARLVALAEATQQLTTTITSNSAADAQARLALAVQIANNAAAILQEATARADELGSETQARQALASRVDDVGGHGTLEAVVNQLFQTDADLTGKLSARAETVAAVPGALAAVRLLATLQNGTTTSSVALVAQAVGIWLQIDANTVMQAMGAAIVDGAPTTRFYGKVIADNFANNAVFTPGYARLAAPVAGTGF